MDFYKKNIEVLETHDPELAELIESFNIDRAKIQVMRAASGVPRVLYTMDNGEEVYIHNADDPSRCANQAIDLLGQMEKEGIAVLFGFGLGYLAEELLERFEKGHIMMVYEASPAMFKIALETRDLSDLLGSEKVKIFLGPDIDNFSIIHDYHSLIANGKFWVVKHHPSVKLDERAYDNFYKRITEEKMITDSGISTAIGLGRNFLNTYMENIPAILKRPGVSTLKNIFKGRPAIIISAGPSLEKNFHLLKKAKGRAVIIAVDVVLPTLLPAGIVPDILVAIDPLPDNLAMFRDNPLCRNVPFICFAQYTPEIVKMYPGPLFLNSGFNNIIHNWLGSLWENKGYVECFGGSVSHFAFGTAEFVGADTIALIGSDLSFTSTNKYHAGETTKLLEEIAGTRAHDVFKDHFPVKDIFGETKYTMNTLLVFKTAFENKIKRYDGKVINATEGGLPIEGAAPMRLADFIDEYCDLPEIDTYDILSKLANEIGAYDLPQLIAKITFARDKFTEIKKKSNRVLKCIKRLKTLKKKGRKDTPEVHGILTNIESVIEEIKHPLLNILSSYHYALELYMMKQDMQDIDEMEDKWERLDKQLERGTFYYKEIVRVIDRFNKQLNRLIEALKVEEKVDAALADVSSDHKRFNRVATIYGKAGMISQSVRYFEMARKSDNAEYNLTHEVYLADMYIKQFRFHEAREVLEEVGKRQARTEEWTRTGGHVEEMLKVCNRKIREWKERKARIGELLQKAEENYGSDLESGYFYFRTNNFEKAEKAYLKAIEQCQSSSDGESTPALFGLAHTYLAMDDPEKAVEVFQKAIEADPDNPILYRDLGFIAYQNNNIEHAEIFFTKAIELAPADADVYKPLASLYMSIGEKEKALALYENALRTNGEHPAIQQDFAIMYKEIIAESNIC